MKDDCLERKLAKLPKLLTGVELARRLGIDYQRVLRIVRETGYPMTDGRRYSQHRRRKFRPEDADWTLSNVALARQFNVSRERVRLIRKQLDKPFVEARGRPRKHGLTRRIKTT